MQPPESEAPPDVVIKDKNLLDLFWALAHNNEDKRIKASHTLVADLHQLQKKNNGEKLCAESNYAFARLVQGLGSGRKSARLGFATALTALLMNTPSSLFNSTKLLKLMARKLSVPTGLKSEKKEIFLGQVFCLLSLVQSKKLVQDDIYENIVTVVKTLLNLSKSKSYLKKMSYHGLCELVSQVSTTCFEETVWPSLFHIFGDGWESCSPELLQLLIICNKCHPGTCGKYFLQSKHWIPHKSKSSNLISKHNFKHIAQIIADTTSCHPAVDGFALEIMSVIGGQGADNLGSFWEEHLTKCLFNSTPERKYLGLKLAVHSLSHVKQQQVPQVWSQELLSNLHYSLQRKDHVLHPVCKKQLPSDLAAKLVEDGVSPEVQSALLFQIFNSPVGLHFDSVTHSNIVSTIVGHLKPLALVKYIDWLKRLFLKGADGNTGIGEIDLGVARRWSGSQLVQLARTPSLPRNEKWISGIARFLFFHSRFTAKPNCKESDIEEIRLAGDHVMDESGIQSSVGQNVASIVTVLSNLPLLPVDESDAPPNSNKEGVAHVPGVMASGGFWLSYLVKFADKLLSSSHADLTFEFDEDLASAWAQTMDNISKVAKVKSSKAAKSSEAKAMELLLIHVALQLLSLDPEVQRSSLSILHDLEVVIKQRFGKKSKKSKPSLDEPDWVEVIVDILLNMMSVDSHSVRVMAEQVFRLVCPHLTKGALNLIIDILKMKSNHDLIKYDRDVMEVDEEDEEDTGEEEEDDSEEESDEEEEQPDEENVDEEFKKRIQEALGDAAAPLDEEEDADVESEEELSDDAMMRLDSALSDLFRLKKKAKPARKDARRHLMHFQIRCLDLVEVFINRHHGNNPLILELVLPLLEVVEHATRDANKDALAERASVILRVKLCKIKHYPRDLDDDAIERCHSNVEAMLKMCNDGNRGVFFSQIASNACLFFLRVLSGCRSGAVDAGRICGAYGALLEDFMTRRQSKVHHCIFTDLVHRQPATAQGLIAPLVNYMKDGVQPYRKTQACLLLYSLFLSSESREKATELARPLVAKIHDIMTSSLASPSEMKPKYFVEVVKLLHLPVVILKRQEDDHDFTSLIETMKKLLDTEEFKRSQAITNNIWKTLNALGLRRVKAEKVRKVKEERKRKKPKAEEDVAVENGVDATKESRRETKSRVMKEKRAARKVKKSVHPESDVDKKERVKKPKKKRKRTDG